MIRKKRRELELSQEYVAMELGISQKAYSDIENGKTKIKNDILYKIAEIFRVRPSEICPISNNCNCLNELTNTDKHQKLVQFLKDNNIDFPEDLA
ncbi:MAG: helix-turn-helix transcriptional regulator [Bacteroidota bacterium]|nr:helix-turn-helix transcriptional regulator [Bacteroidota bacterium]